MGHRHQMFVIARVQGRYRCIAAFHSQWLSGGMVVKTAARLIRAFVNPINAAAISSELDAVERLDTLVIAPKDNTDGENPAVLCPYLTGLFLTCSRVDMEDVHMSKLNLVDMHTPPSRHDNDEGYTCFDLTLKMWPRYCFWWPGTRPLTAYEYIRREEDKQLHPSIYGILGHCALLRSETLADVWPSDFSKRFKRVQLASGERGQDQPPAREALMYDSPSIAYSAASAFDAIKPTNLDGLSEMVELELMGLLRVIALHLGRDGFYRLLDSVRAASLPSIPISHSRASANAEAANLESSPVEAPSMVSAAFAKVWPVQSSNPDLDEEGVSAAFESSLLPPAQVQSLRAELLAATTLNRDDILRLKQLLVAEKCSHVSLTPWLATGALDAVELLNLSDALQHAECLDLSLSSTLTAEILEDLVRRLPNVRHIIAFGCGDLGPLTTALPLTTYLASLTTLESIDQTRLVERGVISMPECLRWVEESDPPAGLTIVMHSPPLALLFKAQTAQVRHGLELSHFGAEGVVHGLSRYLERLYHPDYKARSGYFEMRAYFHSTGSVSVCECIPTSHSSSACYSYGCLPSLIRASSPQDGQAYPAMERSTASGAVTGVPRHPGWVLMLDTKGTMPFHKNFQTVDLRAMFDLSAFRKFATRCRSPKTSESPKDNASKPPPPPIEQSGPGVAAASSSPPPRSTAAPKGSADAARTPHQQGGSLPFLNGASPQKGTSASNDASSSSLPPDDALRPEYAFERWDVIPGQTKQLRVVERVSVREWVKRLPAGHGTVPEALLADCEAVLARLNVALRGSPDEPVATN